MVDIKFATTSYSEFLLDPSKPFCTEEVETLVVVHSSPKRSDYRRIIRSSWGDPVLLPTTRMRALFFVGMRKPELTYHDRLEQHYSKGFTDRSALTNVYA